MKPKEPEPPKVEKPPEPPKREPEARGEEGRAAQARAGPSRRRPRAERRQPRGQHPQEQGTNSKIQTPEQQPKPVKEITRPAPAAPQFASVVTASEIEGVRNKIRPCWNAFGGAKEAPIVS